MGLLDWLLLGATAKTARSARELERSISAQRHRRHKPYKLTVKIDLTEDEYAALDENDRSDYMDDLLDDIEPTLPPGVDIEDVVLTVIPKMGKRKG